MISLVICSITPSKFRNVSDHYDRLLQAHPHEIVGIHDAKSLCEGYNRGLDRSKGDLVLFSHDDVEFLADSFAARIINHLCHHDVVGVAGTTLVEHPNWLASGWPYLAGQIGHHGPDDPRGQFLLSVYGSPVEPATPGAQMLDGVFLAARREAAEKLRFDAEVFDGWHFYDADFSFRAHLAGMRVAVANDLYPIHYSGGTYNAAHEVYANRFLSKHGLKFRHTAPRHNTCATSYATNKRELLKLMTGSNRHG
jgi:GT2 family glycosyltransferase